MNIKRMVALALALAAAPAGALVQPQRINFQGKLLNPSTNNPQAGPVTLTFKLYDVPTGGSALYTETQSNVPLTNGVFSVEIGSVTALPRDLFLGASAYLGVTVSGDSEMTPRQDLVMSAYAFTANQLSDLSEVRLIAGPTYSTFTSAGNLLVPAGVEASSGSFTNGITASSGTFLGAGGVLIDGGPLQIGSNAARQITDDAPNASTDFSSNVAVAGNMSAANFNYVFLGSATLTAATASLTADFNASGYTMVGFEVFVTGSSGATLFRMTLNGDSAAHYAYVYSVNGGATTTGVSQAYIDLTGTTYTGGGYCTIKGSAALGQASDFVAACRRFGAITLAPQTDESGGTYNGTTALTSVTFAASAGTLSAGTTIRVFGAQ